MVKEREERKETETEEKERRERQQRREAERENKYIARKPKFRAGNQSSRTEIYSPSHFQNKSIRPS